MSIRRSILAVAAIAGFATTALVPASASAWGHVGGLSARSVNHVGGSQRPFTSRRQLVGGRPFLMLNPQPLPPPPPPPTHDPIPR
jgi:hypothetical protein